MKKFTRTLAFLFICFQTLHSQIIFQKTYGGPQGEHSYDWALGGGRISMTNDGGYVFCHATLSYGSGPFSQGIYFVKIDANGDTVFTRTFYSANEHCFGRSVQQTSDGGYILGVAFGSAGTGLIKTDAGGNVLWSKKTFDNYEGQYALQLYDNNYLEASGPCLVKLNTSGAITWGKKYVAGNAGNVTFYSIERCTNGDIIAVGVIYDFQTDAIVAKFDSLGTVKFAKRFHQNGADGRALKAVELSDKSIAVVGYHELSSNSTDHNILFLKVDSVGNPLVFQTIGDALFQWSNGVVKDASDNLYFTGVTTYSGSPVNNQGSLLFVKTNASGNLLDMRRYDNGEYGQDLTRTASGEFAILGMTTKSGAGSEDVFVAKTNSLGTAGCNVQPYTLPFNPVTYTTTNLSLTVTSTGTIANYPLNVRAGSQVSTLCYSCTAPSVSITAINATICAGEQMKLTAGGASTYSWSTGSSSSSISVLPSTTTTYTVTGFTGPLCTANASFTVNVNNCTSLPEQEWNASINIYPVPSNGKVTIGATEVIDAIQIIDSNGSTVIFEKPNTEKVDLIITKKGLYFVRIKSHGKDLKSKILIE